MSDKCVYFDGLSATANACTLHINDDCFYVYLIDQNNKSLIFNKSSIVNFHLNENHLTIKFENYPHHVVECYGQKASQYYSQLAKGNVIKTTKGFMSNHKLAVVFTLSFLFIGLIAASYFIVLPWVGQKSAALIPLTTEIKLGESIAQSVLQKNDVNDSATYFANQFILKLKTQSNYPLKITVLKSPDINAFALPGGKLFIYTGIINKMKTYEEFTALLGHEISHITYQHSLKSICRTLSSSLLIAALFGDASGITAGILQQANEIKQLNYSRELETQADEKGFEMLLQNNISPKGMIDLLTMLDAESASMPKIASYFSSHPETIVRIKNIKLKPNSTKVFDENKELKLIFEKLKLNSK